MIDEEERGTDMGAPLGEPKGEEGEPGQPLRLAVTGMGGYWRVDLFGDDFYKTWDCKTPGELGKAIADAYTILRTMVP
jgi:hypothetical protein